MSSKEQKTPEGQAPEEIIMDQHEEIEAVEPEASAEQVDPRDEKIANLEAQLAEAQTRERDGILRVKAEMENLRRRTELDIEKAHKFALEKFINELLPVIDSLDRALEVADKANPDMSAMVEGIELTLKSMLNVWLKFGVEVIAETNVPLRPNVHQAIAMVESDDVAPGNVLGIMPEGLYAEWSYDSCGDGNCSESKSVISVFVIIHGPACECRAVFSYSATLSRSGFTERLLPA